MIPGVVVTVVVGPGTVVVVVVVAVTPGAVVVTVSVGPGIPAILYSSMPTATTAAATAPAAMPFRKSLRDIDDGLLLSIVDIIYARRLIHTSVFMHCFKKEKDSGKPLCHKQKSCKITFQNHKAYEKDRTQGIHFKPYFPSECFDLLSNLPLTMSAQYHVRMVRAASRIAASTLRKPRSVTANAITMVSQILLLRAELLRCLG